MYWLYIDMLGEIVLFWRSYKRHVKHPLTPIQGLQFRDVIWTRLEESDTFGGWTRFWVLQIYDKACILFFSFFFKRIWYSMVKVTLRQTSGSDPRTAKTYNWMMKLITLSLRIIRHWKIKGKSTALIGKLH